MFNFNDFIVENLTKGYANNSFTEQQIKIFAMNYLTRGLLTEESFDFILSEVKRIKKEKLNENEEVEPPTAEEIEEEESNDDAVVEPPTIEEEAEDKVTEEVTQEESQEEFLEENDSDEEPEEV